MSLLSVIIPCLNEVTRLPTLLQILALQRGLSVEVLLADGGSTDGSCDVAIKHGARVISSCSGRARQMNAAARGASGEYLLFLHADSGLSDPEFLLNSVRALQSVIAIRGNDRVAGHFRLRFNHVNDAHAMAWRYVEEKTAFNRPHTTNGDQGLLLKKSYFESLGCFDEGLPFLEDQRLAEKIRAGGVWITLPGCLHTSARRFEQAGFHNQYALMTLIMAMYAADMGDFFSRSPSIYNAQHEAGRVQLTPYFRLIRQLLREMGWQESLSRWLKVGQLGRLHWWQLFYFWDVLLRNMLGQNRYPFMRLYERAIEPFTANRFCDGFSALVLWLYFYLVMTPWFWLKERHVS